MEERTMVDAHGVAVHTRWWTVDEPVAVVLVSHGASEHGGRYDRFARALNAAGFAVTALDHRGHGGTAASTGLGRMGPSGGQALIDDLDQLADEARTSSGDVPLLLFGHSMGALIALAYLTSHADRLSGAVLCGFPASVDDAPAVAALLREAVGGGLGDEPFDAFGENNAPFEPARTPYDWLSRDPDEVDRYVADPLCGDGNPLTYGFALELLGIVAPAGDALDRITCPVLVIAGDQDPAAAMGAHPIALAEALGASRVHVDLRLYEGDRHELLNELDRDQVTADVIAWLRSAAGGR